MRFLSVCSGIEAASVAWKPLGWAPVAFSEIEPFPSAVLRHRHPEVPNLGDMTKYDEWKIDGPVDLVCGGTPCQAFSVAGLRKGLADDRGNLSLVFLGIVAKFRPRWVVWENVPGVFSSVSDDAESPTPPPPPVDMELDGQEVETRDQHDGEELHALNCFLAGLSELGYGWAYRVLDAQHFGVPQRRKRIFVVGHLGDWRRAGAVLFERHSLQGHPAPRRAAGQGVAGTLTKSALDGSSPCGGDGREGLLYACEATSPPLTGGGNTAGGNRNPGTSADDAESLIVATVSAKWAKGSGGPSGDECQNLVAAPLTGNVYADRASEENNLITHALTGEGFDASEYGTGRGTPLLPVSIAIRGRDGGGTIEVGDEVAHALRASQGGGDKPHVLAPVAFNPQAGGKQTSLGFDATTGTTGTLESNQVPAIVFDTTQITSKENRSQPQPGDPCHPLAAEGHPPAIAFSCKDHGADAEDDLAPTMRSMGHDGTHANGGGQIAVAFNVASQNSNGMQGDGPSGDAVETTVSRCLDGSGFTSNQGGTLALAGPRMAVRRLTPRECERLQDFPDDYTLIPWKGRPASECPDGPRYKALGNSWATCVPRWIGERIALVDALPMEGRAA